MGSPVVLAEFSASSLNITVEAITIVKNYEISGNETFLKAHHRTAHSTQ